MTIALPPFLARSALIAATLGLVVACSVATLQPDVKATAPVLDGFGATTLVPARANDTARKLFAQGVAQAYAFNDVESIRAFKAALAQDANCALCAWGVAWQLGPNVNSPRRRSGAAEATRYVDYALKHSAAADTGLAARDRALIESLAMRYGHGPDARAAAAIEQDQCRSGGPSSRADPLDIVYAARMRQLVTRFPDDPDLLSLYAEAEMVATSDAWWDRNTGKPAGRMGEVATLVEKGLVRDPNHVGLLHYMIHAVDSVHVAARAEAAADRLGGLAPSSPHLLHMPSHTYASIGRYADATRVNQLALAADDAQDQELQRQQFTIIKDWRGHNRRFQWYAALMEGRGELALETARAAALHNKNNDTYGEFVRATPMLTLLHLRRWDALLAEPQPTGDKGMATVMDELARGSALARSGKAGEAKAALARLEPAAAKIVAQHAGMDLMSRLFRSVVQTAQAQLGAEVALAEQRTDDALALQAKAAAASFDADGAEPPLLASVAVQRLGTMQLQARRFAEAEQTFRADLAAHPRSGWALTGLNQALTQQGKPGDAAVAARQLELSWASADRALRLAY